MDGHGTLRQNLEVVRVCESFIVINKPDATVLCVGICRYGMTIYDPVKWRKYDDAQRWIDKGCMAEIQESYMILDCGFRKELLYVH